MAKLVNDAGEVLTPEQIAARALEDVFLKVTYSHQEDEELDQCARYFNKQLLSNARSPEKMWKDNRERWRNDAIIRLIRDKAKTVNGYIESIERRDAAVEALIKQYISEGMTPTNARKKATGKE